MAKIAVDIDGVVAKYDLEKIVYHHFGVSVSQEAFHFYSIEEYLGVPTEMVAEMFCYAATQEPKFIVDSREILSSLIEEGHEIHICSNRPKFCGGKVQMRRWLKDYGIPFTELHGKALPFHMDYYVDDYVMALIGQRDTADNLLLFAQPWNENCLNVLWLYHRVLGWAEVKKFIEEKEATR